MGLAPELLPYAENFYRRFPEEFIALGMPGLEEVFDLRVNGSRSRRIIESPSEKTVEITIRRWQPPSSGYGMPGSLPHPFALQNSAYPYGAGMPLPSSAPAPSHFPGACGYAPLGAASSAPPSYDSFAALYSHMMPPQAPQVQPPPEWPAAPAAITGQSVAASAAPSALPDNGQMAQLARLEAALLTLKPQIEKALLAPLEANQLSQTPTVDSVRPTSQPPQSSEKDEASPSSPLRNRRKMQQLKVTAPKYQHPQGAVVQTYPATETAAEMQPVAVTRDSSAEKPIQATGGKQDGRGGPTSADLVRQSSVPASHPGVLRVTTGSSSSQRDGGSEKEQKVERTRPRVVDAVRVAPSAMDPECQSPRSPGKYSVWK